MERGVAGVSNLIQYSLFTLAPTVLQLILVSFIFWQLNVPAVVVCLVVSSGLYVFLTVALTKWRIPQRKARNAAANDVTNRAVDSLINFETVKYFAAEHVEAKRYADLRDIQKGHDIEVATSLAILNVSQSLVVQIGLVSSLLFAAQAVIKGHMSTGDFVACQLYVLELFRPLTMLGTVWSILVNAATDCVEIDALLRVVPEVVDDPDNFGIISLPPTSDTDPRYSGLSVAFEKVSFSYGEGLPGIQDLTFSVKSGGSVALVGPSGSGKSTTGRLLCRLYESDGGSVKVGGVDVKRIEQKELRSVISVVAQETVLFNETIFFNVAYGRPGATREHVENACKKAQLHDKILSWPDGYETNVGERGLRLSGGEKQRLGIARALVRDPAILLLDEATSALDTTTERQIQGAFEAASKGRTTLTIAHRLSTIIDCDEILVLQEGSVIERGSHLDLLEQDDGIYRQMWYAQQQQQEKLEEAEKLKEEAEECCCVFDPNNKQPSSSSSYKSCRVQSKSSCGNENNNSSTNSNSSTNNILTISSSSSPSRSSSNYTTTSSLMPPLPLDSLSRSSSSSTNNTNSTHKQSPLLSPMVIPPSQQESLELSPIYSSEMPSSPPTIASPFIESPFVGARPSESDSDDFDMNMPPPPPITTNKHLVKPNKDRVEMI